MSNFNNKPASLLVNVRHKNFDTEQLCGSFSVIDNIKYRYYNEQL